MAAKATMFKQRWVIVFEDTQIDRGDLYDATELREALHDYPIGLRVISVKKEKK